MLKKTCQTQFFDKSECFSNMLTINILQLNSSFPPSNVLKNPLIFRFLSVHSSKATNYTLLNILTGLRCLFLRSPVLFQKLYAENFSKLLSF